MSSTLDGILDELADELPGAAVSSGRSMSIDLERDRRVGVTNSITEELGSMPESSDSVEYVWHMSCSRTWGGSPLWWGVPSTSRGDGTHGAAVMSDSVR